MRGNGITDMYPAASKIKKFTLDKGTADYILKAYFPWWRQDDLYLSPKSCFLEKNNYDLNTDHLGLVNSRKAGPFGTFTLFTMTGDEGRREDNDSRESQRKQTYKMMDQITSKSYPENEDTWKKVDNRTNFSVWFTSINDNFEHMTTHSSYKSIAVAL